MGVGRALIAPEYVVWTLSELTERLVKRALAKDGGVRCCNWEQWPLPQEQQLYAACDAFASLLVYHALGRCPLLDVPAVRPTGMFEAEMQLSQSQQP
jgi:hypothetical protein